MQNGKLMNKKLMKTKTKPESRYVSPDIREAFVGIESGFAASGTNWYDSEKDGSDVRWGYDETEDLWG